MLSCLKPLGLPSMNNYFSSPASQGYSVDNTPTPSSQLSPTVNLTREYTLAVQTSSYGEIRTTFDQDTSVDHNLEIDLFEEPQLLEQVLRPSRECVQEALSHITPENSLTHLVSNYFQHSEDTSRLCLLIYQSVQRARLFYTPIHNLLEDLHDYNTNQYSLSHSQCQLAYNAFLQFDLHENPFLSPESQTFNDIRGSFSHLRLNLDRLLKKSKSKVNLIRRWSTGPALCLIAASVGVAISAVVIATHALVALVACPTCLAIIPSNMAKKERVHLAQINAAAKGAYVLYNDLDTIDRLVAHLYSVVENDKLLIHLGLERGVDRYPIQEIMKQLLRNRLSFEQRLVDLEEHLFLCFAAINRARAMLLQEIHLHQNSG